MGIYSRLLLLTLLLGLFVQAEETFINTKGLNLAHITHSNKYCKSTKGTNILCQKKELTYLDYEDAQLPDFLSSVKEHIAPIVDKYFATNLKKNTLKNIQDLDEDIAGQWYNERDIKLFSKTPHTYTLSDASSGYTGGAHGFYNLELDNYDIITKEKLTLPDLFLKDYNITLHQIAEEHYKQLRGLKPTQSLTDDNWFDNIFLLADNFAITKKGLYFFYNQYEVQPYASGNIEFMLPYSKIHHLVDPKGALSFVIKSM
ncbi:MAG: Unknown protein [uncultured Sulfurovum sp.]|uniref:DUF3298 domain-containing protein n=1 Tax=uncultured Sulfurovum sp. TaxID=269237 RepID=A0A6S6U914_9BACT|nr:MAG: Unknown protein [uncultured Sulfurovum sp.]